MTVIGYKRSLEVDGVPVEQLQVYLSEKRRRMITIILGLGIIMHRSFGIKSGLSAHLGLNGIPNKKMT